MHHTLPDPETNVLSDLLDAVSVRLKGVDRVSIPASTAIDSPDWIATAITRRTELLAASVRKTVIGCSDLQGIAQLFLDWMNNGRIVRVVGAGRARLAASIPANRLAHGGARVFVQDDIIPMPHTVVSGGIVAASASG